MINDPDKGKKKPPKDSKERDRQKQERDEMKRKTGRGGADNIPNSTGEGWY